MSDQHAMFIEHQISPSLESFRHEFEDTSLAATRYFEDLILFGTSDILAPVKEIARAMVLDWLDEILRREERRKAKRKAAARSRCWYKVRQK